MAELIKVSGPVRKPLFEGVQGENEARSIQFDITPWVEELGDGAVTATAKRSQDSQPYPVTVTKDGNVVTWKPTSTDTAFAGVGSFQLEYTVDSVLAKTCIWSTMVAPSLDPAGDPPDPYDNWLAEMRSIEAGAIQAAEDAEDSADAAAASAASVSGVTSEVENIRIGADGNTYANAGDAVRGQISSVNSKVAGLDNGIVSIGFYGKFVQGSLSNGVLVPTIKYRVSTNDLLSFDRDIVLNIETGFKIGVHTFVDGSFSSDSGWITNGSYFIASGTTFKVVITKTPETSTPADVNEYTSAVTLTTNIHDDVMDAKEKSSHSYDVTVFSLLDVPCERGGYYGNGDLDDTDSTKSARARTATAIQVKKGDYMLNDYDLGYGVIFVPDDMSSITDSGWLLDTNTKWVAPCDGYARITIRKQTSAWIEADQLDMYRAKLHILKRQYEQVGTTESRISNLEKTVKANQNGFTYFDPETLIWGGLEEGERHTYYKWRAITKDIQQYNRDVTVKADDGFRFGVVGYDSASPTWSGWVTSYTIKAGTRFRIQFAKNNDSSSTPAICNAEEVMASHFVYTTELGAKLIGETREHSYVGEKIPSTVHGFDSEKVLTMSYSGGLTSQDIEIYGDYMFVAFSGDTLIRVYSMIDKSLVASLSVDTQHGSGMQFSSEKYDADDVFPLLYVGGWTTNLINVVRITNENDTWSASIVRQLYIPTSKGYYFAPSIDAKHNVLYCYGLKASNYNDHQGMVLLKYDLSQLTDNGNDTYTPKLLSEVTTPDLGVQQGRKYYGGNLYVGFSDTGTPHNSRLVVIDATTGDVKTDIDMTGVTTSENEGVCYQIVDGSIYWYYSDYYNIYRLEF